MPPSLQGTLRPCRTAHKVRSSPQSRLGVLLRPKRCENGSARGGYPIQSRGLTQTLSSSGNLRHAQNSAQRGGVPSRVHSMGLSSKNDLTSTPTEELRQLLLRCPPVRSTFSAPWNLSAPLKCFCVLRMFGAQPFARCLSCNGLGERLALACCWLSPLCSCRRP